MKLPYRNPSLFRKHPFSVCKLFCFGCSLILATSAPSVQAAALPVTQNTTNTFFAGQNVEYTGTGTRYQTRSAAITQWIKMIKDGRAEYTITTQGQLQAPGKEHKSFAIAPVVFHRDLATDEVSYQGANYELIERVVNATVRHVRKSMRQEGHWVETVPLDLGGGFLPDTLTCRFDAQPIKLTNNAPALAIRCLIQPVKLKAAQKGPAAEVTANYASLIIFAPAEDRMYQLASVFEANLSTEKLRVEEFGFLVDSQGKPLQPLIDARKYLNLQGTVSAAKDTPPLPLWTLPALKAQQTINLCCLTAAERGSNPSFLEIISLVNLSDTTVETFGGPSSSTLSDWMTQSLGGDEKAALQAKYYLTCGKATLSGIGTVAEGPLGLLEGAAFVKDIYEAEKLREDIQMLDFNRGLSPTEFTSGLVKVPEPVAGPIIDSTTLVRAPGNVQPPIPPPVITPAPPPPPPQSGISGGDAALIGVGVAGAVVAAVAVAGAASSAMNSYHCSEGYSYCQDGVCCPTHYIHGAWGAYHGSNGACYPSAESAAQAAMHGVSIVACADERQYGREFSIKARLQQTMQANVTHK